MQSVKGETAELDYFWIISGVKRQNWIICRENSEEKLENSQKRL